MKSILFIALSMCVPAAAQGIYVYPATVTAPRGSYQTCTGIVNGYNSKSVTWTTTGGALVGVNPTTANEPGTIALYTTTPGTYTVTGKSTANSSLSGTCVVTITASPTITTGHPRLIVTAAMLPGLQAKATSGNTMYQAALTWITNENYDHDVAPCPPSSSGFGCGWTFSTWNGSACVGGTPSTYMWGPEVDAYLFAWLSMVAPTSALRNQFGCAGRDVWVSAMKNVMSGAVTIGNDPSDHVNGFVFSGDWLMGGGYLSSSDIVLQRQWNAFALRQISRSGDGGNFETGGCIAANNTWNDPSEFSNAVSSVRCMGNNYSNSRMLYLAGLSTMFDDNTTDDPPLTGANNTCGASRYVVCPDMTAGSMHAYLHYLMGAGMYVDYAHLEDPRVTDAAYQAAFSNPANPQCQYQSGTYYSCLGDGRGGESSEGSFYAYSRAKLRDALNVIHSTGNDDPMIWGPQASLGTSSYWDLLYIEDLEFLTGYSGAQYNYLTTGDSNTYVRVPLDYQTEASMLVADSYTGRTDRTSALEWILLNAAPGGPLGTGEGCVGSSCGFTNDIQSEDSGWPIQPIATNMFLALPAGDPTSSLPSDPRPSLPTDLYNASYNQNQLIRNGWTGGNANSVFSFYCGNTIIDHETATCGRFDVYTGGEYITKGRTTFDDYNPLMSSATQSNEVSIMNITGSGANNIWGYAAGLGGEWFHGQEQDFASLNHSELPAYAADIVDQTNLYNGWWVWGWIYDVPSYNDVTAASRSLIYLRGTNQIVIYDRATTGHAAAKGFNLNITGNPTVNGNQVNWPTRSGNQQAYFTTLLPSGATVTATPMVIYPSTSAQYSTLKIGTQEQATATCTLGGGRTSNCTSQVTWSSSNPAIASVNSTGLITAVSAGSAYIYAYYLGIRSYGLVTAVTGPSSGIWSNTSDTDQEGDWELYAQIVVGAGTPKDARFLSVLEWGASSFTKSTTTLVQSSSGQKFDGALVGASLAMFMRSWPGNFTSTTFPASGATSIYVSDLEPSATYSLSGAGVPANATADSAGVLTFGATGTGNITISGTGRAAKITQSSAQSLAQYKIPICICFAAVSLLLIGQAAHRQAEPE